MDIKAKIKSIISKIPVINNIHNRLAWLKGRLFCRINVCRPILKYKKTQTKPVFLIFTPEHENLGDHAIAYAEKLILDDLNIPFYEVTNKQIEMLDYYKLMNSFNGALVLITGGGNLGSLWTWIEDINRQIIINNPDSRIVILPNTIYYGESEEDLRYLEESKKIYNSHNALYIYAREENSYNFMKDIYSNISLVPDMVLSLNHKTDIVRNGCILCLRDDTEALFSEEDLNRIRQISDKLFDGNVICSNTFVENPVSVSERQNEIKAKFNVFSAAQLVITDRLHGMIFAAVTGTNCIVFDSKSPKLRGCYEWIKHLGYIRFADSISDIEDIYRALPRTENVYDNTNILKETEKLKIDLLNHYNSFQKR